MERAASEVRLWLARQWKEISVVGLASTHGPVALREIFVQPVLMPRTVSDYAPEQALHEGGVDLLTWLDRAHRGAGPAVLALTGRAGSGKTTLTRWLAYSLAELDWDLRRLSFHDRLPLPIALRDAPLAELDGLEALVRWWARAVCKVDPGGVTEWLDYRGAILILDGLDEVGGREQRARVMRWVREHPWTAGGEGALRNLTVVTARPTGFDDVLAGAERGVARLSLAPFSQPQIREYVRRWFELPQLQGPESERKARTLLEVLCGARSSESLRTLARRPSYLTVLCVIHHTRGELPPTRAALYAQIIQAYIHALDAERGLKHPGERQPWDHPQDKLEVLSAVAFQAHIGARAGGAPWSGDRQMVWTLEELEAAVERGIRDRQRRLRRARPEHAQAMAEYFVARTGLLVETWAGRFQFAHLSFQEYLTALYLLNQAAGTGDAVAFLRQHVLSRLDQPGWPEVALLTLAIDARRGATHGRVLATLTPGDGHHARFLGKVLAGEELPLGPAEREAWLLAWLFAAADPKLEIDRVSVLSLASNAPTLERLFLVAADAAARGEGAADALAGCFPAGDGGGDSLMGEWLGGGGGGGQPWEAARAWLRPPEGRWRIDPLAELAVAGPLPTVEGEPPAAADEALAELADQVPLIRRSSASNRSTSATLWWWVLDAWLVAAGPRLPALEAAMVGACTLPALLEQRGRAPEALLLGERPEAPLARWRVRAGRLVLEAERAFRAAALFEDAPSPAAAQLWRRLVEARNPSHSALKDRPSRGVVRAVLERSRRPFGAWHEVEVACRDYVTFGTREAAELPPPPPGLDAAPLAALRTDLAERPWRVRWGLWMSALYFLSELHRLGVFDARPVQRRRLTALKAIASDPERLFSGLADPALREVAEGEWAQVLEGPLNPRELIALARAGSWSELAVDDAALSARAAVLAEGGGQAGAR